MLIFSFLELCFLGSLKNNIKFGCKHHFTLDFQLSGHKSLLSVKFSRSKILEILIRNNDGNICFLCRSQGDISTSILEIKGP